MSKELENAVFNRAVFMTLQHEGGYVNDPQDPGGETNYGISKRSYPHLDIKALPLPNAIAIYRRDFWDGPGIGQINDPDLATKLFDLCVNVGPSRAIKWLQRSANLLGAILDADGRIGPETARVINSYPHQPALIAGLRYFAAEHYIRQRQARFLAGWLKRLES